MKLKEFESMLISAGKEADRIALSRKVKSPDIGSCVIVPTYTSRQKSVACRLGAEIDERGLVFRPHDTRIPVPHLRAVWIVVFADFLTSMGVPATIE